MYCDAKKVCPWEPENKKSANLFLWSMHRSTKNDDERCDTILTLTVGKDKGYNRVCDNSTLQTQRTHDFLDIPTIAGARTSGHAFHNPYLDLLGST